MSPEQLASLGRALYGERWQTSLAADLHVTDRTMRRWLAGDSQIPDGLESELRILATKRIDEIGKLIGGYSPTEEVNMIAGTDLDATIAHIPVRDRLPHTIQLVLAEKARNEPSRPWRLLEGVFSMHLKPGDLAEPLGPGFVQDTTRSMIPTDLTDQDVATLLLLLSDVGDPEARARIGDVLWIKTKDVSAAQVAVEAYLDSGMRLEDPAHWSLGWQRYERATRLAHQLGRTGPMRARALSHIEARLRHSDAEDPYFFTDSCLRLLYDLRHGDPLELSRYATKGAERARAAHDFHRARIYLETAAKLLHRAKDTVAAEKAETALAQTFAEEAEGAELRGENMIAHQFWENAIQAFRKLPACRDRIPELHARLNKAGERAREQMKPIQVAKVDLTPQIAQAQAAIAGRSFSEAMYVFVAMVPFLDPSQMRAEALDMARDTPLLSMIRATRVDDRGRAIHHQPPLSLKDDDSEKQAEALRSRAEWLAGIHRDLRAQGSIAPGLWTLLEEHSISEQEILDLLSDSSLIPQDRLGIFVAGFMAGFRREFMIAAHLLVPQIEHMLRLLLHQHGVITAGIDSDGIEEDWSLGKVLAHPKLEEIIGQATSYELKGLLTYKGGPNLRNRLTHGLLSFEQFGTAPVVYLWWVMLKLCLMASPKFQA